MNIPATRKHMVRCARRRSEHHAAPRQSSSRATQLNLATTSAQLWKTTRCTERVGGMINSARHLAQFNIARICYPDTMMLIFSRSACKYGTSSPFLMLHLPPHVALFPKYFQWVSGSAKSSMQHACNMARTIVLLWHNPEKGWFNPEMTAAC